MSNGIRTTNLERKFAIDELIGNVTEDGVEKTGRIPFEALLNQIAGTGAVVFGNTVYVLTKAQLDAYTPILPLAGGVVLNDPDPANNGYYARSGGAWLKGRGFPDTAARLVSVAGSANAATAQVQVGVNPADAIFLFFTPLYRNTGAVTLSVNGDAARPLVAFDGEPLQADYLIADATVPIYDNGTEYRLLFDHRWQVLAEQAEADADRSHDAADRSEAARDVAAGYASDAVSQGNVPIYATADGLPGLNIPVGINTIRVNGESAAGDGEGGEYVDTNNGSNRTILSGDGRTWYRTSINRRRYIDVGDFCSMDDTQDAGAGITAAIAAGEGREVVFSNPYGGRRNYKLTTGLSFALSDVELIGADGATIDISALVAASTSAAPALDFSGTLDASVSLTANVAAGALTLAVASATGIAANDWIFLEDTRSWWTTSTYGEWVKVKSIASLVLTLWGGTRYAYTTANAAKVSKANLLTGLKARGLRFRGLGDGTRLQTGLRFRRAIGGLIEDIKTEGCDYLGSVFNNSLFCELRGGDYRNAIYAGFSYGHGVTSSCLGTKISSVYGDDLRHAVTVGGSGGICIDTTVIDVSGRNMRDATVDAHPQVDGAKFTKIFHHDAGSGGQDGVIYQGANGSIQDVHLLNKVTRNGVFVQPAANERGSFSVADIFGDATEAVVSVQMTSDAQGIDINNVIGRGGTRQVYLVASGGAKVRRWGISGVKSTSALPLRGVHVQASGAGTEVSNGSISQCHLETSSTASNTESIYLQGTDAPSITEVSVVGCTTKGGSFGLRGANTDYITTGANSFRGATAARSVSGANNALGADIVA